MEVFKQRENLHVQFVVITSNPSVQKVYEEVFDEYSHFLCKNDRYQTTDKHVFNGKQETALKPQRMTPHLWKLKYNRNCQGTYELSNMKCYEYFYCVLFTVIDIDFCNLFINYDS